ncbi:Cupin domain protein [Roseivivax jejudonensis]|uniref:Cupin domain protein n=1 Tax=Roseivivax jejudonensis TaxID=1529041 RepID=A0A1X6ZE51_9RHOB|nr:cupin domain-containing protein [Roseivivax jejudonensis]SLN48713.1 Cupin domain protein [Roseivivax jejudonensis]
MEISRAGTRPSEAANSDYFTGQVRFDPVTRPRDPARHAALVVTFEPGARTNWHTHPLGQTLFVLSGAGLAQTEGGPVHRLRPGDSVWFPPNQKHWHGAGPDTAMSHMAIQEAEDGRAADWLEPVSDADYNSPPTDD